MVKHAISPILGKSLEIPPPHPTTPHHTPPPPPPYLFNQYPVGDYAWCVSPGCAVLMFIIKCTHNYLMRIVYEAGLNPD